MSSHHATSSSKPSRSNDPLKPSPHRSSEKSHIRQAFRPYVSVLIMATRTAEKVCTAAKVDASPGKEQDVRHKAIKDAVDNIIKQRQLLRQAATILEGKLRGNVKESEALHCCLRSQPCVGGRRKRNFTLANTSDRDFTK